MRRGLTIVLLSVFLAFTSCNRGHGPVSPKTEITATEYEVLASWVDAKFTSKEQVSGSISKIVIFNTTSDNPHLQWEDNGRPVPWEREAESLRKQEPALQKTTTDAFGDANLHQAFLRRSLRCAIDCIIVDSARLEPIFKKGGREWLGYYKQFSGAPGLLTFSRVGFSTDSAQALFYVSNICGGLCGCGYYVVMERHDSHWVIEKEINVWVS